MSFYFDHAYNNYFTEQDYLKLEALGFTINPSYVVEHPGTRFCRFIYFKQTYLEFIETKDPAEHRRIEPNAPVERFTSSGFSFGGDGLFEHYNQKRVELEKFGVLFEHRNYNWKENAVDRLPGWNFIRFSQQPIKNIFMWVTEYEPNPHRKKSERPPHKNGALDVVGSIWSLDWNKSDLPKYLGLDSLDIPDHKIYQYQIEGKDSPFKAAVIKCSDLKFFEDSDHFQRIELNGEVAYHYRNNSPKQWDFVFIL